ncbi:uncharacterized protein Z519_03578 [Cladophialophora bantiana CBS 173.52]|uniref:FMN hydroxy acid dehydrogenase domain-containing protein n=1 Tax=Cladophialophora bantiana (strain ATCC 10958 / CBS 173.52 / CDC B-1940 / NIH 8579) TaxID=1442370 RepID=A0A0D2IIE8_CLAB1|nr:uncharacterized protein Z519_03578 [Cladophialophora bantiana CBS 173.52]KIW96509.1 hypothetical protein Z519_03578 [Cladophialophora bantiana CBS 173.52]
MPDAVNLQGADNDSPVRFFQLYLPHDDELAVSLLKRAVTNGFAACILTTDTWQLGWRLVDVLTSSYAFYRGIGADLGFADPIFQRRMEKTGIDPKKQPEDAGAMWIDNKELSCGKPFCTKESNPCGDLDVDGIVVSNHAGRQVDGTIASLDALENIVNARISEKLTVMFDSGARGASDIIKALCLGANFVWVVRMWIYGLSIMGEEGARRVMKCLAEFDISMLTAGIRNVGEMQRRRQESYPKGYTLIAKKAKL